MCVCMYMHACTLVCVCVCGCVHVRASMCACVHVCTKTKVLLYLCPSYYCMLAITLFAVLFTCTYYVLWSYLPPLSSSLIYPLSFSPYYFLFCMFLPPRFYMWERKVYTCFALSGLFHLIWWFPVLSIFLQATRFHYFYHWTCHYVYIPHFIFYPISHWWASRLIR